MVGAIRVLALLILVTAILACQPDADDYPAPVFIESQDCEDIQTSPLPLSDITLSTGGMEVTLQVELADEPIERTQGMMCRESIPPGTGMLFTYNIDRSDGFWMYNTYVAIDILHIDRSGKVVDKINMSPCPRDSDPALEPDEPWKIRCAIDASLYIPMGQWRYALELPAGWLDEQGMGDPIFLNMKVSGPEIGK